MTRDREDGQVRSVDFDRATRTLRVEFEGGSAYDCADVPERVFDELRHSPDQAGYFRAHVRDEFVCRRSDDVDLAEVANELREDALLAEEDEAAGRGAETEGEAPRRHGRGRRSTHTWIVDVMDEDSAAVEVDGRQITPIPRWLLPSDAHDGDVLRVTHERGTSRSAIVIELDRDGTRAAFDRSRRQLADSGPGDAGGDIAL